MRRWKGNDGGRCLANSARFVPSLRPSPLVEDPGGTGSDGGEAVERGDAGPKIRRRPVAGVHPWETGPMHAKLKPSHPKPEPSLRTEGRSPSPTPPDRTARAFWRLVEPSNRTMAASNPLVEPSNRTITASIRTAVPHNRTVEPSSRTVVPSSRTKAPHNRTVEPWGAGKLGAGGTLTAAGCLEKAAAGCAQSKSRGLRSVSVG